MNKKAKNILLAIFFFAIYIIIWRLLPIFSGFQFLDLLIGYIIMAIILVCMLYYIKKLGILKFDKKNFFKGLKIGIIFILIALLGLIMGIAINIHDGNSFAPIIEIVCFIIAIGVGTGFCEETLYRGVIQNLMYDTFGKNTKKGIVLSIVITALLFGGMHLGNFTLTGWTSVGQFFSTIGMGLFFGAVYARCKSLWTVVFLHGFWDVCVSVESGLFGIGEILEGAKDSEILKSQIISGIEILIIFIMVFMILLRKKKEKEYIEK